jgi:hypothetical protein
LSVAVRVSAASRQRLGTGIAAFGVAFVGTLLVALAQGSKVFYFDSGHYWLLGETFVQNGHFSLLNFESPTRGYVLPLICHELQAVANSLLWKPSSLVKLFNALIFALIGAVLAPRLAEIAWPQHRWGLKRRIALAALLVVFWDGFLNFPLSDLPGLAMALLALVAISRPDSPGWMLTAGVAAALALDIRAAYLLFAGVLIVLVAWAWLDRRGTQQASTARRALCAGLLIVGFAAVSLPQSLTAHRYYNTWSFVPGATLDLASQYLTPGLGLQRVGAYVGPGLPPSMEYVDPAGARLLHEQKNGKIASTGQYLGLIASHPITMGALLGRHVINGLDARYSTPYVEHIDPRLGLRLAGFLLVFLALVRVLWPTARRSLGPAKWRYPVALLLCCLTSVPAPMEPRYMLPTYLVGYTLVLTPGWPNPLGPAEAGLWRFRTLAILVVSYLVFMAVVWHVVSATTKNLHIG